MAAKRYADDMPGGSELRTKKPRLDDGFESPPKDVNRNGNTLGDFTSFNQALGPSPQNNDEARKEEELTADEEWLNLAAQVGNDSLSGCSNFLDFRNLPDLLEPALAQENTTIDQVDTTYAAKVKDLVSTFIEATSVPTTNRAEGAADPVAETRREFDVADKPAVSTKVEEQEDYFSVWPRSGGYKKPSSAHQRPEKKSFERDLILTVPVPVRDHKTRNLVLSSERLESTLEHFSSQPSHPWVPSDADHAYDSISMEARYAANFTETTFGELWNKPQGYAQPSVHPPPNGFDNFTPNERGQPPWNPRDSQLRTGSQNLDAYNGHEDGFAHFDDSRHRIVYPPSNQNYGDKQDPVRPQNQFQISSSAQVPDDEDRASETITGWPFQKPKPKTGPWPPLYPDMTQPGPGGSGTWPCDWIKLPFGRDQKKYPEFPDGKEVIPGRHALELYCYWFPNHVWGVGLDPFQDESLGGGFIWNHYHPNAVEVCRQITIKSGHPLSDRPWNFLQKQLGRRRETKKVEARVAKLRGHGEVEPNEPSERTRTGHRPPQPSAGPRTKRKSSKTKKIREQISESQPRHRQTEAGRSFPSDISEVARSVRENNLNGGDPNSLVNEYRPPNEPWWEPRFRAQIDRTRCLLWQMGQGFEKLPYNEQLHQADYHIRRLFPTYAKDLWLQIRNGDIVLPDLLHPMAALHFMYQRLTPMCYQVQVAEEQQFCDRMMEHYLRDLDARLRNEERMFFRNFPSGNLLHQHHNGQAFESSQEPIQGSAQSITAAPRARNTGNALSADLSPLSQTIDPRLLYRRVFDSPMPKDACVHGLGPSLCDGGVAQSTNFERTIRSPPILPGPSTWMLNQRVSGDLLNNIKSRDQQQRKGIETRPVPEQPG